MASLTEHARRRLPDLWAPVVLLVFAVVGSWPAAASQPDASRPFDAAGVVLVVVAALALIAVRRRPGLALLLNGAAVAGYLVAGYPYGPILLTVPAAMYGTAAVWRARRAGAAVAADLAVLLGAGFAKRLREGQADDLTELALHGLVWTAVVAAAYAIGTAVRVRREAAAGVRSEQARRAASEERLRMAQDLHDSIGHGLAVIAMQAGVALHVLDRDPAKAREAMEAVRATSREALDGLRVRLEELRCPGAAERRPAPGLADLGRLTERVRAGGVTLRVDVEPGLPEMPPAVDAAAYRILQESLTNALRHAGATTVVIRVGREDSMLLLDITDDGPAGSRGDAPRAPADVPARTGDAGGSGIDGMRAQAEALRGSVHAGPRPGGGFAVVARLPLNGAEGR